MSQVRRSEGLNLPQSHTWSPSLWGTRPRSSQTSGSEPRLMVPYVLEQVYTPSVTEGPSECESYTLHTFRKKKVPRKSPNDTIVPYPTNQPQQSYTTISSTTNLGSRSVKIHRPRNNTIFNRLGPSTKEPINWVIAPSLSSFHARSDARSSRPRRGEYTSWIVEMSLNAEKHCSNIGRVALSSCSRCSFCGGTVDCGGT